MTLPSNAAISLLALLSACGDSADQDEDPTVVATTVVLEGGGAWAVHVDPEAPLLEADPLDRPRDLLAGEALDAVDATPAAFQDGLARTLATLTAEEADRLAAEILGAPAEQVDEVAWTIGATDPAILSWLLENGWEWLFADNAAAIYALQGVLPYADLVELEDGRTTLETVGEEGVSTLEPDLYYRLVAYPRAYIDLPAPNGDVFWRSYWLEDDTYGETLVEAVEGALTVQAAALALGTWIQSYMTFGYTSNDIWPLDIYWEAYGSCGEYSILTTAAARTALIPTVTVSARADDHEWNEFWDGRWIMWDNSLGEIGSNPHYPYIDWPEIFDDDLNGSGVLGEVAHVFRFLPDESVEPSDLYTSLVPVEIHVTDAAGAPMEGARVQALTYESGYWMCTWAPTDAAGVASMSIGDDQFIAFAADHAFMEAIEEDRWSLRTDLCTPPCQGSLAFEDILPRRALDRGSPPEGPLRLTASWIVTESEVRVANPVTEGYELGQTYGVRQEGGAVDVFLLDAAGQEHWAAGEPFDAWALTPATGVGSLEVRLPDDEPWTLVFSNEPFPDVHRTLEVDVRVERIP
ncbi:MAG: transglutaminase domain-containing protein [Deltaproteobacteria bacterium]|nr:transglutaminase domain-containing protein [Deltaproteobacteria bacterium]